MGHSKEIKGHLQEASSQLLSLVRKFNALLMSLSGYLNLMRRHKSIKKKNDSRWKHCRRKDKTYCSVKSRRQRLKRKDEWKRKRRFRWKKSS